MRTVILLGVTVIFSVPGLWPSAVRRRRSRRVVTVIQVPVVVRDHDGHVVSNLGKDDFQLFTDGNGRRSPPSRWRTPGQAAPDRSLPDGKAPAAQPARGTGTEIPARFITYLFDDVNIPGLRRPEAHSRRRRAATWRIAARRSRGHLHIVMHLYHSISPTTGPKLQDALSRLQSRPPSICRRRADPDTPVRVIESGGENRCPTCRRGGTSYSSLPGSI